MRRKFPVLLTLAAALVAMTLGSGQANADEKFKVLEKGKKAQAARKEAFKRAAALGLKPGAAGWKSKGANLKATGRSTLAGTEGLPVFAEPGAVPHYFGPWGNWAYSPMPRGAVVTLNVTNGGSGYNNPLVTIDDVYGTGSGAAASAEIASGVITGMTMTKTGTGYQHPIVSIVDVGATTPAIVTATADAGTGEITSFTIVDGGIGYTAPTVTITDDPASCVVPCGKNARANAVVSALAISGFTMTATGSGYSAPWVTITDNPALCGGFAPQLPCGTGATADAFIGGPFDANTGIRKFIDKMPGLGPLEANTLVPPGRTTGQYIVIAQKDAVTYTAPASDYYEIGLVEFYEKMHTDLPPTLQRGYVQLATAIVPGTVALKYLSGPLKGQTIKYPGTITPILAVDDPHFLGPTIVGTSNTPVRFKFYNLLPVGAKDPVTGRRPGDLFIPVDETVMGSGLGPGAGGTAPGETYTQNRAAVHLHGNNTVWISDGTPHQWITPANEVTPYPQGVSVRNVPDMLPMPDAPDDGTMTLYYTNAMSARLMFYHDHAMGITRLNVYAGEAAGYLLTDQIDTDLIGGTNFSGVNCFDPPRCLISKKVLPDFGIPLVIQDRTFVDAATIFAQDPTWNWGTGTRDAAGKLSDPTPAVTGDLWVPHVYMSAQNPGDVGGMNAFGRWHYGPWFTPPTPTCTAPNTPAGCIEVGPLPNEYFGLGAWEPALRPGIPNPSIPGEAFNDTPIVNGTAYPFLEVEPRAYRFRVLNAANDRFLNLQLYKAYTKNNFYSGTGAADPATAIEACTALMDPTICTEVKMIAVGGAPNQAADTPSGLPEPTTAGPNWIQIGTEGGWLAAPVVVPQQPVGWNMDPTAFNVGVVNQHSLLLGTAERADVVVDFSAYPGQTFILYNDAPAAFPAGVPTYDYFTGVANQMDVGGAPTTQPGYGPNTRTIMQIRVGTTVTVGKETPDVTLANLQAVWAKATGKRGVFEATQDPILIPQAPYNSAYNATFPNNANQFYMIGDTQKTFQPINKAGALQPAVTLPLQMKAMHDEMGGVYDTQFGRMSGMLGLTNPQRGNAFLIPYNFASPPTDVIRGSADVDAQPVGSLGDGTQIWRVFHNGVDTHTIHVHLFNAQLVNRIGQDNWMVAAEPAEFGWKDTFRINPLEVTFLAMRPVVPTQTQVPFEVPDSIRLIDPTLPEAASLFEPAPAGWFDPAGNPITQILNHFVNFGWEYVWHCHILAHEEMDMMHSLVAAVAPMAPTLFSGSVTGSVNNPSVTLTWTDNSQKEVGFGIQRATDVAFATGLTNFTYVNPAVGAPNLATYVDTTVAPDTRYWYRVSAQGAPVGDTQVYPGSIGFPTMTANSVPLVAGLITVGNPPGLPDFPPTNLAATLQAGPKVSLAWRDNATNETGFSVERCTGAGCTSSAQIAVAPAVKNTGNTSFVDATVTPGNTYLYQVAAINGVGASAYAPIPPAIVQAIVPAIPAAPTGLTVTAVKANGNNYAATLTWVHPGGANLTNFTIQRATNSSFTTGLNNTNYAAGLRTTPQTVLKNTTYYYRIRANNSISGSSAWTNALPFPIRTGP
jgi:FtsP/CotA-like multicopper oxidase with cupredoxin domain